MSAPGKEETDRCHLIPLGTTESQFITRGETHQNTGTHKEDTLETVPVVQTVEHVIYPRSQIGERETAKERTPSMTTNTASPRL